MTKNSERLILWGVEMALGALFVVANEVGQRVLKNDYYRHCQELTGCSSARNRISNTLSGLRRRGYVIVDGDSVILTNKAKMRVVDQLAAKLPLSPKFFVISFDIPESLSVNRGQFRRVIKRMGFRQIQKSLWISNRQLGDLVEAAAIEYKVNDYVAYFVAEESSIDQHIKQVFRRRVSNNL